jgi:hypothetical protein
MLKDGWRAEPDLAAAPRLSVASEAVIARAGSLTRMEIDRLDRADRDAAGFRLVTWDVLRSRMDHGDVWAMRLSARDRAWAAVAQSMLALGADLLPGDDYWRVTTGFGWGAARAACFAACVFVAPDLLEPDIAEMLLRPWLTLDGLDAATTNYASISRVEPRSHATHVVEDPLGSTRTPE